MGIKTNVISDEQVDAVDKIQKHRPVQPLHSELVK